MFIKDIIVLIKYYRIFLAVLNIVIKHSEDRGTRLVIKPIFYTRNFIIIL
jgi:hypothetical protein